MAARRCSIDGINYPAGSAWVQGVQKCPVCGEPTTYFSDVEHDEDWKEKAALALEQRASVQEDVPDVPTLEGAKIVTREGRYFISSHDVIRGGVRHRLEMPDLVRVGKQVFEVQAYSDALREYWVIPFSFGLTDEDLERLSVGA